MSLAICLSKSKLANEMAEKLNDFHPYIASKQEDLLTFLKISIKPTIVLLDFTLYKEELYSLTSYLEYLYEDDVKLIVLDEELSKAKDLLDIGIVGYARLNTSDATLKQGIQKVLKGELWVQRKVIDTSIYTSLVPKKEKKKKFLIKDVSIFLSLKPLPKKEPIYEKNQTKAKFRGKYSEYHIKISSIQENAFVVTDTLKNRDGSDFIYGNITELVFEDITISLSALKECLEQGKEEKECVEEKEIKSIKCINPEIFEDILQKDKWTKVSIHVENYFEKEDHLYFDTTNIPKNVIYSYSVGENGLNISFKGEANAKDYVKLLTSLSYENNSKTKTIKTRNLHVKIDDSTTLKTDIIVEDDTI